MIAKLPPYLEKRLGAQGTQQTLALRSTLAESGLAIPAFVDDRPGSLRAVIADLTPHAPLSQTEAALCTTYAVQLSLCLGALVVATAAPQGVLVTSDPHSAKALQVASSELGLKVVLVPAVFPAQPELDVLPNEEGGRAWVVDERQLRQTALALQRPLPKLCTVTGDVATPTVVPLVGSPTPRDLVHQAGGPAWPAWVPVVGGLPSGRLWDADEPIPEETRLLLCLSPNHPQVLRLRRSPQEWLKRARSVCQGCRICTESCPVHLRGGNLSPADLAFRLSSGLAVKGPVSQAIANERCLGCGACDLTCPHQLAPMQLAMAVTASIQETQPERPRNHTETARTRRLPMALVESRLGLSAGSGP